MGALATAARGTALGVVRELHARGRFEVGYADEPRPLPRGSRLTAWELAQEGIPHSVQADGAAADTILRGEVDAAIVGPDRIAAIGDTANTHDHGRPGHQDRGRHPHRTPRRGRGVGMGRSARTAPVESRGHKPACDVRPGRLVTPPMTERGVLEGASGQLPVATRTSCTPALRASYALNAPELSIRLPVRLAEPP